MSDRDSAGSAAPRPPGIRLLPPYEDPYPRRVAPGQGFLDLEDPPTVVNESPFGLRRSTTLSDDVTVVLPALEPETRIFDRLASPPASTHLVAEREEDPSIVCDPTDPEVLTNTLALTPRLDALWVHTESSWAIPSDPGPAWLARKWLTVAALIALCMAALVIVVIATDGDAPPAEQSTSAQAGGTP